MKKIAISKLNELYALISSDKKLYLPVETETNVAQYKEYADDVKVALDAVNTVKSAKDFLFPQSEDLVEFKTDGKKIEIKDLKKASEPYVLFGVRACDAKSFEILDNVFLKGYLDTYYEAKRKAGIIVTHACSAPDTTCFCKAFGIDAANPQGDVSTWTAGDYLYWNANTEKGEELTNAVASLLEDADETAVNEEKAKITDIVNKLPYSDISLEGFDTYNKENLDRLFKAPEWEELSSACLGCGTCTFICPTCQCYDIRDFKTSNGDITRFRCWDSCMFSDFTKCAHGNMRNTQMQRYRQRFMHKLYYYPDNNDGTFGCVGCGRCVAKCPQSLNIVKVIKKLGTKGGQN
jgi:ferredoxin